MRRYLEWTVSVYSFAVFSLDRIVKVDKLNDIKDGPGLFDFVAAYCSRRAQYPDSCVMIALFAFYSR